MNISAFHLTGSDMEVIAAAAGAMLGALGAYVVGLLVERRAKRSEIRRNEQSVLFDYSRSIAIAEACCQEMLMVLYDAERLLGRCADKIQEGNWVMSLPRQVNITDVAALDFRNEQLMTEWLALRFQVDKLNHITQEFCDHYMTITKEYSSMALRGENGVAQVVEDNDLALHSFALNVQGATGETIKAVKHVYALVIAHIQLRNHLQPRSAEELAKLRVIDSHYEKIRSRLDKRFSQETLYGAPKAPPPVPAAEEPAQSPAPSPAAS